MLFSSHTLTDANGVTTTNTYDANGNIPVSATTGVDVVIDIGGWFGPTGQAGFVPIDSARVLDTRTGSQTGQCNFANDPDPNNNPCVSLTPGALTEYVKVSGQAGYPALNEMTAGGAQTRRKYGRASARGFVSLGRPSAKDMVGAL